MTGQASTWPLVAQASTWLLVAQFRLREQLLQLLGKAHFHTHVGFAEATATNFSLQVRRVHTFLFNKTYCAVLDNAQYAA